MRDQIKEIRELFRGAHRRCSKVGVEVGCAHQDPIPHGIDQHDAPIRVFEEDLASRAGFKEPRVIQDNVRSLGSAHEGAGSAECGISAVHPGPGDIDDDVGGNSEYVPG